MGKPRGDPCILLESLFFLSPVNRAFNLLEMMGKRGFQKTGRSIMSWRKYFALERCRRPRYPIAIDVEFCVWDEATKKPASAKITGRLVNISVKGACLQTNIVRIGYHHLVVNNDLEGKTPLILEFPPSSEGIPWTLKSQIF